MPIQMKRSALADLNQDHILLEGQMGLEYPDAINQSSFPRIKIGNGVTKWSSNNTFDIGNDSYRIKSITANTLYLSTLTAN